jgi:hypothetical protein
MPSASELLSIKTCLKQLFSAITANIPFRISRIVPLKNLLLNESDIEIIRKRKATTAQQINQANKNAIANAVSVSRTRPH